MKKNPQPTTIEELQKAIRLEWYKACQHDKIPPESKFVVFSPDNPYMGENSRYHKLIGILQNTMNNIRHGYRNPHNSQYEAFHGNPPAKKRIVKIPLPEGPLTAIGRAVRIEYEPYGSSNHVGTRFYHDFGDTGEKMIKARPILVSDKKGNIFFVPQDPKYPHFSNLGILG